MPQFIVEYTDNIKADYSSGVLSLHIPVHESAKPRKVSISSSDTPHQLTT